MSEVRAELWTPLSRKPRLEPAPWRVKCIGPAFSVVGWAVYADALRERARMRKATAERSRTLDGNVVSAHDQSRRGGDVNARGRGEFRFQKAVTGGKRGRKDDGRTLPDWKEEGGRLVMRQVCHYTYTPLLSTMQLLFHLQPTRTTRANVHSVPPRCRSRPNLEACLHHADTLVGLWSWFGHVCSHEAQRGGMHVVDGHLGGGCRMRGHAGLGQLCSRDYVVLAWEVAKFKRETRPRTSASVRTSREMANRSCACTARPFMTKTEVDQPLPSQVRRNPGPGRGGAARDCCGTMGGVGGC